MKLMITGAGGSVGKQLEKGLNDFEIIPVFKNIEQKGSNTRGFIWDISTPSPEHIHAVTPIIIHTAASASKDIGNIYRSNILGTKHLMEFAVKCNAVHVIFFSSGAVYGYNRDIFMTEEMNPEPVSAYGESKLVGERILKGYHDLYHIPVTIFRLYFPFGPGLETGIFKMIENSIRSGKTLNIKKEGEPAFTPIHMQDLTDAVRKNISGDHNEFKIFNLCGNDPVNFREIVSIYESQMKIKAILNFTDEEEGDILGNNGLLKKETGWKPVYGKHEIIESIKESI